MLHVKVTLVNCNHTSCQSAWISDEVYYAPASPTHLIIFYLSPIMQYRFTLLNVFAAGLATS